MGYYTQHDLSIVKGDITIQEIYKQWENNEFKFEGFEYYLDEDGDCSTEGKWYSHREDMVELSKRYKDVVFLLEGYGEDSGDIWKEYYKNGLMQYCPVKMTFDEYNEEELEEIKSR